MILGGCTPQGEDAVNDLTYLLIEQWNYLEAIMPVLSVRLNSCLLYTSWSSDQGLMHTENALSLTNNKIDAIICANDDIAAGAISALEQAGLAGDVIITGADANLSALKYIMDGKQYSTIWQDSKSQHEQCVDLALKLMKGEALGDSDTSYNNGKMDIPAYKLEIDFIKNKEDMQESVIADGRYTDSEVFGE